VKRRGVRTYTAREIDELLSEHVKRMHRGRSPRDKRFARHLSPRMRARVSRKIRILIHEGYPQRQAVAIAYSMCVGRRRR
jgi:hypothetical protein